MPLIKLKSKGAFAHNVRAEIAAGKPVKQAVAIAYSEKRAAGGSDHHSNHSQKRSQHYHTQVVPNAVKSSATKMTRLEQKKMSAEDDISTGHTVKRHP